MLTVLALVETSKQVRAAVEGSIEQSQGRCWLCDYLTIIDISLGGVQEYRFRLVNCYCGSEKSVEQVSPIRATFLLLKFR